MNKITTIHNDRMQSFIAVILEQTKVALNERMEDMLTAWHENMAEATANEKNLPPLKIGVASTVDLEAAKIETTIRFTVIYQSSLSSPLPDPNQPELPIE